MLIERLDRAGAIDVSGKGREVRLPPGIDLEQPDARAARDIGMGKRVFEELPGRRNRHLRLADLVPGKDVASLPAGQRQLLARRGVVALQEAEAPFSLQMAVPEMADVNGGRPRRAPVV